MTVHNCKYCKAECGFGGEDRQRDCKGYIPMTNADRIRAMTDEELVKFIDDAPVEGCPDPTRNCRASCQECIMDWLHQPAEDE